MNLIVKYFFLGDVLFLRGHLRFGCIQFPLADVFYMGGNLRLELSWIWVSTVNLFNVPIASVYQSEDK